MITIKDGFKLGIGVVLSQLFIGLVVSIFLLGGTFLFKDKVTSMLIEQMMQPGATP